MRFDRSFYKLSGSGNDFVVFDELTGPVEPLPDAERVRALCRRGTGVGADGVAILRPDPELDYGLIYFNADGSRAELCGNASLCSVHLAVELGRADPTGVTFRTDAGRVAARIRDGLPEIDLGPATELEPDRSDLATEGLQPGERRIGYARVGVPHLVIHCGSVAEADLARRGPALRHHPALSDGANVNFVSWSGERWAIRTYERGVEAETLACGTGSVASALLLASWPETGLGPDRTPDGAGQESRVELVTSSGLVHRVTLRRHGPHEPWRPSLAGSARIVFRGELGEPG